MKTTWMSALALTALVALPMGCQEKETAPTAATGSSSTGGIAPTPPGAPTSGTETTATAPPPEGGPMMAGGATGGAPMMGGGQKLTMAQAVEEAPKDDKALVPLASAYSKADAELKKAPKDANAKKAFVDAAYNYGHAAEYDDTLQSPVKYRSALYLYRKALAVDPQHTPSIKEKEQIEQIYAGMPGGVPKE